MDLLSDYRANKDEFFATNPNSPLPPDLRAGFSGLEYFPTDPGLVFTVPIVPGDGAPVTIATSDGAERTYHRAGKVHMVIAGEPVELALFDTGHPGYFLPFRDGTSGRESYGAGRYLDLHPNADGTVTIDFNFAYNPFCAYTDRFSCALPPHENWLTVPIRAGEMAFRAH
jgi:uncharacterized protein (DUF1684 family)